MAGFIRLFSFKARIKFWCILIEKRSETRHILIAQTADQNSAMIDNYINLMIYDRVQK